MTIQLWDCCHRHFYNTIISHFGFAPHSPPTHAFLCFSSSVLIRNWIVVNHKVTLTMKSISEACLLMIKHFISKRDTATSWSEMTANIHEGWMSMEKKEKRRYPFFQIQSMVIFLLLKWISLHEIMSELQLFRENFIAHVAQSNCHHRHWLITSSCQCLYCS